ncbi:hypothetical protein SGPA1_20777 [Streptomyces misionensis JCM 4497]
MRARAAGPANGGRTMPRGAWGLAVASFESFGREGAYQVVELTAGALDEQRVVPCIALHRLVERRGGPLPRMLAVSGALA